MVEVFLRIRDSSEGGGRTVIGKTLLAGLAGRRRVSCVLLSFAVANQDKRRLARDLSACW